MQKIEAPKKKKQLKISQKVKYILEIYAGGCSYSSSGGVCQRGSGY